jgi:predicted RNase H-like HicB family nuclease
MAEDDFNVAIHPAPEGGFWVEVEGLPGCITQAANQTVALARVRDAHAAWEDAPAPASSPAGGSRTNAVPGTAGEAAAWLSAGGWSCTHESEHHFVFVKAEPAARVTLPKPGDEALTEGYRGALAAVAG